MALIVEDGTGLPDAQTLAAAAFVDDYHTARANDAWALLDEAAKEAAILKANDYLELHYGTRYKGEKAHELQALDWPRYGACVDGYEVNGDSIPVALKKAVASLALRASNGELAPDIAQQVKREKVDVVEVEYMEGSTVQVRYREIDGLLVRYLSSGNYNTRIAYG